MRSGLSLAWAPIAAMSDGKLVGVVSRPDLLRVFLRTDREIRDEMRDQVIEREMGLNPGALYVAVHNGVVSVSGSVERTGITALLTEMIGRVDGVVEVREQLHCRVGRPRREADPSA